jgi:AbrB family looped-hinge helix DNA binding protein
LNTVSKITSKGQITLPCFIRNKAGFAIGDTIEFEVNGNCVVMRKPKNLMDYTGCLNGANLPDYFDAPLAQEEVKRVLESY